MVTTLGLEFYGRVAIRALSYKWQSNSGIALALGIGTYLVAVAPLETNCLASAPLLIGIVCVGCAGQIALLHHHRRAEFHPRWSIGAVILFFVFFAFLVLFLINGAVWTYTDIDDRMGYLVFPVRILEQGCIGRDPFQFRRIESGLGSGGAYIYAIFKAMLPVRQTRLADLGVGAICLLLLVGEHCQELKLNRVKQAIALLVALWFIAFSPVINNTPETLGKALLYALMRVPTKSYSDPPHLKRGILLSVLLAALVLLKTTYLPAAAAVVAGFYISALVEGPRPLVLLEAVGFAFCTFGFLLPWMAVSHQISNTFWYPILGSGTLDRTEGAEFASLAGFVHNASALAIIMLPAISIGYERWKQDSSCRLVWVSIPVATFVFVTITQIKFTIFGYRYGEMGAATLFLFYTPISLTAEFRGRRIASVVAGLQVFVGLLLFTSHTQDHRWFSDGQLVRLAEGSSQSGESVDSDATVRFQLAIPPRRKFVALVTRPFRLNFDRNEIAVMDWPAMMGPAGMPSQFDPLSWKNYLLKNDYWYLVYSFGDGAGYPDRRVTRDLSLSSFSKYQRRLLTRFRAINHIFSSFKRCTRPMYEDKSVAVIDLRLVTDRCVESNILDRTGE